MASEASNSQRKFAVRYRLATRLHRGFEGLVQPLMMIKRKKEKTPSKFKILLQVCKSTQCIVIY